MGHGKVFEYGLKHAVASNFPISDRAIAQRVKRRIVPGAYDQLISKKIESSDPIAIGRLGGTEARYLGNLVKLFSGYRNIGTLHRRFASRDLSRRRIEVNSNAGFFSAGLDEELKFMEIYISALSNLDVLGAWGDAFAWVEELGDIEHKVPIVPLAVLSPWIDAYQYSLESSSGLPWVNSLEGKKVLVVSPFIKTFELQHKDISKAFQKKNYPAFELQTLKAPMTFGEVSSINNNWFKNLDLLISQSGELDFDIALIGAGAYSLPLVHAIKQQGKKAIHCGGGLQLFFSVMGRRWINSPYVLKYYNEHWTRPSVEELHHKSEHVENSCYW